MTLRQASLIDPFDVLGLDRTTATEEAVKASYAALLKKTRPEDDREAFMALRNAFSQARAVAKGNDAMRAAEPEPRPAPPDTVELSGTSELQPEEAPAKWIHDEVLDWSFADNPQGELLKDTLTWMVGGAQDGAKHFSDIAERLLSDATIDEPFFRQEIINFIVAKADKDHEQDYVREWEVFDVAHPDWLTPDVMRHLAHDLRLFKDRPNVSWAARNYNVALKLFAPVLDTPAKDFDPIVPVDAARIFADEQDKQFEDGHGSYFDREAMIWRDKSPVGQAMHDIQEAIAQHLWDLPDRLRAIFSRDELQVIDDFQQLDSRLRNLICTETGWHTQSRRPVYPEWLTKKVVLLLDDTFGWSRHYGRQGWERQQFDWLHKVISRDRRMDHGQRSFRAAQTAIPIPPQPRDTEPSFLWVTLRFFVNKPIWLLATYSGYRILQTLLRVTF